LPLFDEESDRSVTIRGWTIWAAFIFRRLTLLTTVRHPGQLYLFCFPFFYLLYSIQPVLWMYSIAAFVTKQSHKKKTHGQRKACRAD
jgi:hypothetical protein